MIKCNTRGRPRHQLQYPRSPSLPEVALATFLPRFLVSRVRSSLLAKWFARVMLFSTVSSRRHSEAPDLSWAPCPCFYLIFVLLAHRTEKRSKKKNILNKDSLELLSPLAQVRRRASRTFFCETLTMIPRGRAAQRQDYVRVGAATSVRKDRRPDNGGWTLHGRCAPEHLNNVVLCHCVYLPWNTSF
jgi:hypothetical protein